MNGTNRTTLLIVGLLFAAGLSALAAPASADDRDLLQTSTGNPYVFILFDTSGSMHWTPRCTAEQQAAGECDFLCPTGDCFAPRNGDDPASKLYQAKEALFAVLEEIDDIDFGFATYNQDGLHLRAKHWLYAAEQDGPTISGFGAFPAVGAQEVFGLQWDCDTNNNPNDNSDNNIGCYANTPADLDDAWELPRVQRLPKGGILFDTLRRFFVRTSGGTVYRITYQPSSGDLGDANIGVVVTHEQCTNSDCSSRTQTGSSTVTFRRIGDFNSWDIGVDRDDRQRGFFSQATASDSPATNTCAGWDPNDDTDVDEFSDYSIRWQTVPHPTVSPELDEGDVLPLSWQADNRQKILERLAPNLALGELFPDFRTGRYFEDLPDPGASHLQLRDEGARPLIGFGATPLGASIQSFRTWYAGCPQGNCPNDTGWKDIADDQPDWGCRRKFLLILTDGDETCGGGNDACNGTAALRSQEDIKTYVVAFGVQGGSNVLTCMANNGGTGEPVFPQNKQQLIDSLNLIFGEISEEARSFAAAAVPSVQAQVADKIYLTNFTPLNGASVWDGHVDAYLRPLPLTEDGRPDESVSCPRSTPEGPVNVQCHAWDAGEQLIDQAPTEDDVLADVYRLGNAPAERRVLYPLAPLLPGVPRTARRLLPPEDDEVALWLDLINGMGIGFDVTDLTPAQDRARDVIRFTLRQKEDTIDVDGVPTPITYVLGDIFHSSPAVVSTPERFRYFAADLYGNGNSCTATTEPNRGYRCFFNRHRYRHKFILVGSNDTQLHSFDAGRFHGFLDNGAADFDNGTGNEIFSIIPRTLLPTTRRLAERTRQDWGFDGIPVVDDVFIDPVHNSVPDPDQREWRTVAITGLREGGAAYLAVDVTQPDKLDEPGEGEVFFLPEITTNYVPSCLSSYDEGACGPLRFPTILWEFTDSEVPDQDGNGVRDLGDAWSTPNTGRLRVIENGAPVDKFVMVVGGGMDRQRLDSAGDWLYLVDIETGKPIYKRQLLGSAPSEPAAVDTDQDGYLDTIYIGTTAGWMYKVDVSVPAELRDVVIGGTTVRRIDDASWTPFRIFDTGGKPIYFPAAVIYVAQLGRYALGFGTGDREDLWSVSSPDDPVDGRFYLILDEGFALGDAILPLVETNYAEVPAVGAEEEGGNFLLNPETGRRPGWFMTLGTDERVITKAFSLSGVTFFTSYIPETVIIPTGPGNEPPQPGPDPGESPVCGKTGESRIFVVYTDSANAVLTVEGAKTRFWSVSEFVTDPFTEQGATQNPPDTGGGHHSDELTDALREVMETLKGLFPDDCRFGNFTLNIKTIRSDTGVVFIAPVPICIVEKNWKEF